MKKLIVRILAGNLAGVLAHRTRTADGLMNVTPVDGDPLPSHQVPVDHVEPVEFEGHTVHYCAKHPSGNGVQMQPMMPLATGGLKVWRDGEFHEPAGDALFGDVFKPGAFVAVPIRR